MAQWVIHKMKNASGKKGFMVIKLDLEKAYDRLSWNFVVDSLKELGLNSHLINVI